MKKITFEEMKALEPCWLEDEGGEDRLRRCFLRGGKLISLSALDILNLKDVSADDKMWAVLREELVPAPILHEFACRCAEHALASVENPDSRSIEAIAVKRAWLKGEATDGELKVAARGASWIAARDAGVTARAAAWEAAWDAWAARAAFCEATRDAARKWQLQELKNMLVEAEGGVF